MNVYAESDLSVHIPNSFTVTGDGLNESFGPVFQIGKKKFQIQIYNRWGEEFFYQPI